jgi:GNAT superfamily N-acetyltransferase
LASRPRRGSDSPWPAPRNNSGRSPRPGTRHTADPTGHDVARLRATVDRGGLVALAADLATGRVVGGGLCAPPHCGVSELAAVGVRPGYRRRGIASALTALLTTACPTVGITSPFLTPAGDAEERIYRRAGYRPVTEMLHISRPVTAS